MIVLTSAYLLCFDHPFRETPEWFFEIASCTQKGLIKTCRVGAVWNRMAGPEGSPAAAAFQMQGLLGSNSTSVDRNQLCRLSSHILMLLLLHSDKPRGDTEEVSINCKLNTHSIRSSLRHCLGMIYYLEQGSHKLVRHLKPF